MGKVPVLKPQSVNRPRSAFDLSQRHLFSAHAGMLLPVLSLDLIPHDHVKISAQDFMRCLPCNSTAFLSMRGVYEFYFVPYSQLWSPFDQLVTGMHDFRTVQLWNRYNSYSNSKALTVPSVKRSSINAWLEKNHYKLHVVDSSDIDGSTSHAFGDRTFNRIMSLTGTVTSVDDTKNTVNVTFPYGTAVDNSVITSNKGTLVSNNHEGLTVKFDKPVITDTGGQVNLDNPVTLVDHSTSSSSSSGSSTSGSSTSGSTRPDGTNSQGYTGYKSWGSGRSYNNPTSFIAPHDSAKDDLCGFSKSYDAVRLLDLLGYGRFFPDGSGVGHSSGSGYVDSEGCHTFDKDWITRNDRSYNPFRLLAYHKIYEDHYRNTTYEDYDPTYFNIDGDVDTVSTPLDQLLELHYRNCNLDFLTNIRPSFVYDGVSEKSLTDYLNIDGSKLDLDGTTVKDTSGFSIMSLRAGYALEKLAAQTMLAGKTYADQIKAHFGISVSEGRDHKCTYIGGFDSNYEFNDVTQSVGNFDYDNSKTLGFSVSKGLGSGSGSIEFDAKEHGVLMCIYSLIPSFGYDYNRLDPFNKKFSRGDYFVPEFENLGLQAVTADQLYDGVNSVLGYGPRYNEYKSAIDINHGQFANELSYFTTSKSRILKEHLTKLVNGDTDYVLQIKLDLFKVSPTLLDSVFNVSYDGSQQSDCVYGGVNFQIAKVSDMSETGLPNY